MVVEVSGDGMSPNDDQQVSNRRSGCGCLVAIFGGLLILTGSLFVMTFVDGVISSDPDVTDNTAAFIFLLAVTVLPGVYLIRRSRRQVRAAAKQSDIGRQDQPPVDTGFGVQPRNAVEVDDQPSAAPTTASTTLTRLSITRPSTMGGRPYTVLFDDEPLGKLQPGATGEYEIPAGLHWVILKSRKHESNTMIIEPREGDQVHLECRPAGGDLTDNVGHTIEGILLDRIE